MLQRTILIFCGHLDSISLEEPTTYALKASPAMSTEEKPRDPLPEVTDNEPPATDNSPVSKPRPKEIGGPKGPEPTRYGDWEKAGRCIDF